MKKYFSLLIIVIVCMSCKKDPLPLREGYLPCENGNFIPTPVDIPITYLEGAQHTLPAFNPNDANEFAYQHFENGIYQLRRHNIQTGENVLLMDNVNLISKPSWSSTDWIAFDSYPLYRIRAIHARNETIAQVSDEIYGLYPLWMPSGEEIMYQYSPVLANPFYLIRKGLNNGQVLAAPADTLFFGWHSRMAVAKNAPIIAGRFEDGGISQLAVGNAQNELFQPEVPVELNKHILYSISSVSVAPDGNTLYFSTYLNNPDDGLFKVDVASGTLDKVLGHCRREQITDTDCSPDGNQLIMVRQHERFGYHENGQPDGKIYQQSRIYLLNLQTGEEQLIELP